MVVREKHRGAVGRRCLEHLCGNLPTGTGPVFDHHRHAQRVLEALGQRARNGVGTTAGRKTHQDAQGFGLGHGGRHGQAGHQNGQAAQGT